jgi:hypothetical protein
MVICVFNLHVSFSLSLSCISLCMSLSICLYPSFSIFCCSNTFACYTVQVVIFTSLVPSFAVVPISFSNSRSFSNYIHVPVSLALSRALCLTVFRSFLRDFLTIYLFFKYRHIQFASLLKACFSIGFLRPSRPFQS